MLCRMFLLYGKTQYGTVLYGTVGYGAARRPRDDTRDSAAPPPAMRTPARPLPSCAPPRALCRHARKPLRPQAFSFARQVLCKPLIAARVESARMHDFMSTKEPQNVS